MGPTHALNPKKIYLMARLLKTMLPWEILDCSMINQKGWIMVIQINEKRKGPKVHNANLYRQ